MALYRQVRRRRAFGWTGKSAAGALAIGIWTKSLAFAADAEELIFDSMGFQCPFRRLIASGVPEAGSLRAPGWHDEAYYRSNRESRSQEKSPLTSSTRYG